ncbi:MAG: hypothetical protein M9953_13925 [Thermomicrobiales bacterium]|nr:hypothetical protein [Thermomicrobiales bacterium]MCO5227155.1 hypothetical protein [Thermomicrobiales bacterium]
MDNFTYETVERMERFATFLENFRGRILEIRGPVKTVSHTQIETWEQIETEFTKHIKEQRESLEQSANTSRVVASTRLYESTSEHVAELERLMTALRPRVMEAQTLEQQLLTADREVEICEDSLVDAGKDNLRRYASAIRDYLDVRSSTY